MLAVATLFAGPVSSAIAAPPAKAPGQCTTAEWRNPGNFQSCVERLGDLASDRVNCVKAPTPSAPDSGMAGWFATRPESSRQGGPQGLYSNYGYAGYDYTTYDIGCVSTVMHPDYKFESTIANGEMLIATSIIGASNALRERAWNPAEMWGWADPLVEQATKAIYQKVFTVFGAVTLAVIGLYLLWRSRQSDMSGTVTTAGWALLIMVVITAIAAWPTWSANAADRTLVTSLGVIHGAVGPQPVDASPDQCRNLDPTACTDIRPPAVRASDTAAEGLLYRNWLRGVLGSADSEVAQKYGRVLYDAKSYSWDEIEKLRQDPQLRQSIIEQKASRWQKVAETIKVEDPEAYEYLQGTRGMERIGAGFIAILSALFFSMFDIVASLLVLIGFLIFRWAVIAAPILGTIGLMRPASSGIRRLANAVVAAIFNIIVFGTAAAIYLFAVNLIMGTASLPGWLQVVLIWLTGVVGWLLLRPYRRITQLGGKDSSQAVTSAGSWHRLFFRDLRAAAALKVVDAGGTSEPTMGRSREVLQTVQRPESRTDDHPTVTTPSRRAESAVPGEPATSQPGASQPGTSQPGTGQPATGQPGASEPSTSPGQQPATAPERRTSRRWQSPDVPRTTPSFGVYRPGSDEDAPAPNRSRRPESATIPG
ncbi:MAG TPA: MFS transporter [Micromonosporaceae bacterium]|nr:MFS transporter [Micromonosporaceae bacterium]